MGELSVPIIYEDDPGARTITVTVEGMDPIVFVADTFEIETLQHSLTVTALRKPAPFQGFRIRYPNP